MIQRKFNFSHMLVALLLSMTAALPTHAAPQCSQIWSHAQNFVSTQISKANQEAELQAKDLLARSENLKNNLTSRGSHRGISRLAPYDAIIVGSGPHAAISVRTIREIKPEASLLVLSKDSPGAVFRSRRDFFFINSPELENASANTLPGSKGQLKDFGDMKYHPAGNLGDHIVRTIYDKKTDFLFDSEMVQLTKDTENKDLAEIKLANGESLFAKMAIVAVGLGEKHYGFKDPKYEAIAREIVKEESNLPVELPRQVEAFDDFSARMQSQVAAGNSPLDIYKDKTVLISGWGGDATNVTIEAFDGWAPGTLYGDTKIGTVGLRNGKLRVGPQSGQVHLLTVGGHWSPEEYRTVAKPRYRETVSNTIPNMIQIKGKIVAIQRTTINGTKKLILTDDSGKTYLVDHYIAAVGYRQTLPALFGPQSQLIAVKDTTGTGVPQVVALGLPEVPQAIAVGPAIGSEIPKEELEPTITKNPASINVLGKRTEQAVRDLWYKIMGSRN